MTPKRPLRPETMLATLVNKRQVAQATLELTIAPSRPFVWHAGQYVSLVLPGGDPRRDVRPYSIWTHPSESKAGEFVSVMRLVEGGKASTWLQAIPIGETIQIIAPLGVFWVREPIAARVQLVGTGTGIVPLRAMLYELAELRSSLSNDLRSETKVDVFFGVRSSEDLFNVEELAALTKKAGGTFFITQSQPTAGVPVTTQVGRVNGHVLASLANPAETQVYLCGNGAMIEELSAALGERGVPAKQIIREKYF